MEKLKSGQRIWIYFIDKVLTDSEIEVIGNRIKTFCASWFSHGKPLNADGFIFENRFIVLAVNEDVFEASGCSIDKSTIFLKEIAKEFQLDLFNKMLIPYKEADNIMFMNFASVEENKEKLKNNGNVLFYDMTLTHSDDFENSFLKPVKQHWINRFL